MAREDFDPAAIFGGIKSEAARIRRRAQGARPRAAPRALGRAFGASLLALLLLVALPPFMWPIRGKITSAFFLRTKPDSPLPLALEFHGGLDIAAPTGTIVRATAIGIVAEAGTSPDLGNYVVISHLFGLSSVYGHLSRIDARKSSLALPGLGSLGAVGSTGRSTGPHLHFAIRSGSSGLPPRPLLAFHSIRRTLLGF